MRKTIFILLCMLGAVFGYSQNTKFQLSSHVLDITTGQPASGIRVKLEKQRQDKSWESIEVKTTDSNGRISDFLPSVKDNTGIYKVTFYTEEYFKMQKISTFYPYIEVVFTISDNKHYHVPITLSPYGYSTYRGS
ncbi:hydroxyisourate hydrolase [Elizabethkingia meningoseptica]|uniref:5-hydroxyisourate hydrolase n=1 Tax=Elizabethkingia meningoseptica TaxID=238 RepID=A0A1T3FK90_ELIME|nr:hydroxyisourate hydrolase [Elizabethkingia meningoseptica]MBG0515546.1 hydroxyisourate hydrolase [Elizabethkingia meningoseptica]OHT32051.1 hydroxyisourate hydrolase [Elizabethkingia meningoseptica]OOH96871.1 hydroxyisourate hydrolase [Elizabethkingia meningoseptica]OPB78196.1 hydroxyisourate hydrolase [Elizabethkingia meningoseptica]